jgi:transcriptional regulator with XRE-family HTH domain
MPKVVKALKTPEMQNRLTAELLGQYLRAKRTQLGLTIEDAAAFCRVTKDTVMNAEHGNPNIHLRSLLQICNGLGVKLQVVPWDDEEQKDVWV